MKIELLFSDKAVNDRFIKMSSQLVVITGRSWDPITKQYSNDMNKEQFKFIGNTAGGETPPFLLICGDVNPVPLFDNVDYFNNIGSRIDRLFNVQKPQEVILFVHGFNNDLTDAKEKGASIQKCTNKSVIVFDWPSSCSGWLVDEITGYARDSEIASTSVRALDWLLHLLLCNVDRVHVFSHSMGSRIAAASLSNIVYNYRITNSTSYKDKISKLGKLIFKESDIDIINMAKFVSQAVPIMNKINKNIYVITYVHNNDHALELSQTIHGGDRAGQLDGARELLDILHGADNVEIETIPLHIINASKIRTLSFIGYGNHSYFDDKIFQESINIALSGGYDERNDIIIIPL
jgi:hypothetical protein